MNLEICVVHNQLLCIYNRGDTLCLFMLDIRYVFIYCNIIIRYYNYSPISYTSLWMVDSNTPKLLSDDAYSDYSQKFNLSSKVPSNVS